MYHTIHDTRYDDACGWTRIFSGRGSKSLVARVLASVSDLTDEVGSFSRSSEEVFLLVRDLAMGHEAVRRHLLASEMAARLAVFVMRDHAPAEVCCVCVCVCVLRGVRGFSVFIPGEGGRGGGVYS